LIAPNEVCVPGVTAGTAPALAPPVCAHAASTMPYCAPATAMTALARKERRCGLIGSLSSCVLIDDFLD
jgi:hypothetical protein